MKIEVKLSREHRAQMRGEGREKGESSVGRPAQCIIYTYLSEKFSS